uniref:Tick transposon n=1 Tax=Rhipicephalus appendiculatus TaxID=34631 RepID=A0A131YB23_RHIAP
MRLLLFQTWFWCTTDGVSFFGHIGKHTPPAAFRKKTASPRWRNDARWIDVQAATPLSTRTRDIVAFRHAPSMDWEAYIQRTGTV